MPMVANDVDQMNEYNHLSDPSFFKIGTCFMVKLLINPDCPFYGTKAGLWSLLPLTTELSNSFLRPNVVILH